MNIRKPVDYSQMYEALDNLLVSSMEQTKLFCEIGKVIDERPERVQQLRPQSISMQPALRRVVFPSEPAPYARFLSCL